MNNQEITLFDLYAAAALTGIIARETSNYEIDTAYNTYFINKSLDIAKIALEKRNYMLTHPNIKQEEK